MKNIITILFLSLIAFGLKAQQIPYTSLFTESQAFWNPAATAYGEDLVINTLLRKQWVSFSGAPTTGFIDYQRPFLDQNMSVGGMASFDKVGPLTNISLQANYAYKLIGVLGGDNSQLSFGISAGIQSYNFDATEEVYNDEGDPLIASFGGIAPRMALGMFYISNTRKYSGNSFYMGFSMNQVLQSKVIKELTNQQRTRHIVIDLGTKIYGYDGYLEPSLSVNYVSPEVLDMMVGVKYEMRDAFWAGLGYSSAKELAVQGGIIVNDVNGRFSRLKIGASSNIAISQKIKDFGLGFELFVRYEFEMR